MESMKRFIDGNRGELDTRIRRALGDPNASLDDEERERWITNDESLYHWARFEGAMDDEDDEEEEE